jgi:porin
MNITENDEGYNYNFWGAEIAYHPETALGAGNYRLGIEGTSSAFLDPSGEKKDSLLSYDLSFDQEFGNIVGGFLRFTWQQEDAAVDYKALYSGGINFSGKGWNRDEDNIGVGYAYLEGGNQSVENTQVFEAYYRAVLNEYAAITADIQYMKDDITNVDSRQENPEGWIFGMRLTAEF